MTEKLEQPAPDVVEARKFWLSIREPGMVPRRKGPWPTKQAAEILREMMDAWPTAYIDYITLDYEGAPQIEHGPEILQMLDGRSMSKGSKHNQRVEDAEAALQARSDARTHDDALEDAVIERCAQVCENIYNGEGYAAGDWPTPDECAAAIRNLKGKAKP